MSKIILPTGWARKTIGEIATVSSGGTPSRKKVIYWNGSIPWVTTAEVDFGIIVDSVQKITDEGLNNSSAKLFPIDTILVAMYGQGKTRGKVAKLGIEAATNQACAAIILKKECNLDFYFQYLKSQYKNIRDLSNSGGQENLSGGIVKSIQVPIPPLPEQRKIAQILSTWDKAINATEALIANSQQQKKALMQQLLTGKKRFVGFEGEWEAVKLGDAISLMKSGLSRKLESENIGIAVIRSNNIGERYTTNNDLKYWYKDDPQGAKVDSYILDDGDILVNFINSISQIGKTCIYKKYNDLDAIYTTNLLRLKADLNVVSSDFLFYLTKTEQYLANIQAITKPAVNQASFTTKEFSKISFLLPSHKEQKKITTTLTVADQEIDTLQQKLTHLKQEKKAMMQQLLTGKRRVTIN